MDNITIQENKNMADETKLLYINACVRGGQLSRTKKISDAFINEIEKNNPEVKIIEKDLMLMNPLFLNYFSFKQREELIQNKNFNHFNFDLANEFAQADKIVIAAPFWEFSYPAILRVYIENVSVAGITFRYENDKSIGMCKADKMLFITTRGADFSKPENQDLEMGSRHLKIMCKEFGIDNYYCIAGDGLDLQRADPNKIVDDKIKEAKILAKTFI